MFIWFWKTFIYYCSIFNRAFIIFSFYSLACQIFILKLFLNAVDTSCVAPQFLFLLSKCLNQFIRFIISKLLLHTWIFRFRFIDVDRYIVNNPKLIFVFFMYLYLCCKTVIIFAKNYYCPLWNANNVHNLC